MKELFKKADANHDGMISLDEAKATLPMHPGTGNGARRRNDDGRLA